MLRIRLGALALLGENHIQTPSEESRSWLLVGHVADLKATGGEDLVSTHCLSCIASVVLVFFVIWLARVVSATPMHGVGMASPSVWNGGVRGGRWVGGVRRWWCVCP